MQFLNFLHFLDENWDIRWPKEPQLKNKPYELIGEEPYSERIFINL
jgi:hypothetical protein